MKQRIGFINSSCIRQGRLLSTEAATKRLSDMNPEARSALYQSILYPAKPVLSAAQKAFFNRIGASGLATPIELRECLAHPSLPKTEKGDVTRFEELNTKGIQILEVLAKDYIRARWPKLPNDGMELAFKIYTSPGNICTIAKSVGMDYAVIEFGGIPSITRPTLQAYISKGNKISENPDESIEPHARGENKERAPGLDAMPSPSEVYSKIFRAILAMIFEKQGVLVTRSFLDRFLFSATFNTDLLIRPQNPMLRLVHVLRRMKMSGVDYRLLHESGRLSNDSIYVVGVYSGLDKLAEANGPSLLVAQERAAVEALRKIYLVESSKLKRSTDCLSDLPIGDVRLRELTFLHSVVDHPSNHKDIY